MIIIRKTLKTNVGDGKRVFGIKVIQKTIVFSWVVTCLYVNFQVLLVKMLFVFGRDGSEKKKKN